MLALTRVPDAEDARKALIRIRAALESSLTRSTEEPPEPDSTVILVSQMHDVLTLATWSWGATLELARSALPQATWDVLSNATGVSDATLHSQLMSWRRKEAAR